jgi:hypothetical protein
LKPPPALSESLVRGLGSRGQQEADKIEMTVEEKKCEMGIASQHSTMTRNIRWGSDIFAEQCFTRLMKLLNCSQMLLL